MSMLWLPLVALLGGGVDGARARPTPRARRPQQPARHTRTTRPTTRSTRPTTRPTSGSPLSHAGRHILDSQLDTQWRALESSPLDSHVGHFSGCAPRVGEIVDVGRGEERSGPARSGREVVRALLALANRMRDHEEQLHGMTCADVLERFARGIEEELR